MFQLPDKGRFEAMVFANGVGDLLSREMMVK